MVTRTNPATPATLSSTSRLPVQPTPIPGMSPIKVTKSPSKAVPTVLPAGTGGLAPAQKVIIVSSAGNVGGGNSQLLHHKALTVKAAGAVATSTSSVMQSRTSIIPAPSPPVPASNGNLGNIVTVASASVAQTSHHYHQQHIVHTKSGNQPHLNIASIKSKSQ